MLVTVGWLWLLSSGQLLHTPALALACPHYLRTAATADALDTAPLTASQTIPQ
jgi:hypothetical protein